MTLSWTAASSPDQSSSMLASAFSQGSLYPLEPLRAALNLICLVIGPLFCLGFIAWLIMSLLLKSLAFMSAQVWSSAFWML